MVTRADANQIKDNKEITLIDWGNTIIKKIVRDAVGNVTELEGELNLAGDVKSTEKKLTWLADVPDLIPVVMRKYGYLITKEKFEEYPTPLTSHVISSSSRLSFRSSHPSRLFSSRLFFLSLFFLTSFSSHLFPHIFFLISFSSHLFSSLFPRISFSPHLFFLASLLFFLASLLFFLPSLLFSSLFFSSHLFSLPPSLIPRIPFVDIRAQTTNWRST
jgi:tRNA synthetases class I (E and Q), anti-codon binding domain